MANYIKRFQNNGNYYYFGDAPVHITSITLNESSLTLNTVGETYQLTATVDNPDACDTHIHWNSSNSSIAVVSKTGLVMCIYPGDCTITASCDGITATCSVSYTKATGVTLNKSTIGLPNAGDTFQLIATVAPVDAAITDVTWSSSNTSIATVSDTGLVMCITPGECTITCTTVDGGYTASCSVVESIRTFVNFLLVGGGGGGGCSNGNAGGGGGGAGGFIECCGYELSESSYSITIGGGGGTLANGGNSCFGEIVAYGGGKGGCAEQAGGSGGSGGGGGAYGCAGTGCSGQGNNGGKGRECYYGHGGGGGGAGGGGQVGNSDKGGNGGTGKCSDISGTLCWYAGGGGGGKGYLGGSEGSGGCGGGGRGSTDNGCHASYYGGGGGGAGKGNYWGGNGCKGVFILRYPTSCGFRISGGTCYTCGDYTIHCFTSDGTLCIN